MGNRFMDRVETFVGVGLLLLVILGFILMLISNLPTSSDVAARTHLLKAVPNDIFDGSNETNKKIRKLTVPSLVPVQLDSRNLGKSNIFQGR